MKILLCNIRYGGADDGENGWPYRRTFALDVIRDQAPDLIGFQEMWWPQRAYFEAALPAFETYAMADEPVGGQPMNAIFYRREAFALRSAGGYWLSHTPHVPGSRAWDSACTRLVNWIQLEDRETGASFRFVNTHLDHVSQCAREGQARCVVEDARAYPEAYPQILTGDMNCDAANPAIEVFRSGGWADTYDVVHGTEDPGFTFHAFQGPAFESRVGKMDWIFTRGGIAVRDAAVIRNARDGRFPSDHYFVSAELSLSV
jgi:endonuclease/exonuclease/phosphatase family metal-dependent hydrolase